MFSIVGRDIVSDEGFSISFGEPTGVTYQAGERSIFVETEHAVLPFGLIVYMNSAKIGRERGEDANLSQRDKAAIGDRIKTALRFWRGYEADIVIEEQPFFR
jgi:hypothetical protein